MDDLGCRPMPDDPRLTADFGAALSRRLRAARSGAEARQAIRDTEQRFKLRLDLRTARRIRAWLADNGYALAAEALGRYLDCDASGMTIPVERLRQSADFIRMERSLLERTGKELLRQTGAMLDAKERRRAVTALHDKGAFNDAGIAIEWINSYAEPVPDVDLYGTVGRAHIKAFPDLTIIRDGARLTASGTLRLEFHDDYDFNPEDPGGFEWRDFPSWALGLAVDQNPLNIEDMQALSLQGAAAEFPIDTTWTYTVVPLPRYERLLWEAAWLTREAVGERMRTGMYRAAPKLRIHHDEAFAWLA